jgi:hypothetical protein
VGVLVVAERPAGNGIPAGGAGSEVADRPRVASSPSSSASAGAHLRENVAGAALPIPDDALDRLDGIAADR